MSTGTTQRTRARRDLKAVVTEPWQRPAATTADVGGRDVHCPPCGGGSRGGGGPVF